MRSMFRRTNKILTVQSPSESLCVCCSAASEAADGRGQPLLVLAGAQVKEKCGFPGGLSCQASAGVRVIWRAGQLQVAEPWL